MTDKEIIQALECCADLFDCISCPCKEFCGDLGKLQQNALDLINRLEIENKNYSHNIKQLTADNMKLKAKIDGLRSSYVFATVEKIKFEAIKEFIEKLKEKKHVAIPFDGYTVDKDDWAIYKEDIDETYKEMVGEQK